MEKLYSEKDILDMFGIEKQTIAQWCSRGYIPYRKIGRKRFFTQTDINEFIENRKREPV